jgi:hypothetical protein
MAFIMVFTVNSVLAAFYQSLARIANLAQQQATGSMDGV